MKKSLAIYSLIAAIFLTITSTIISYFGNDVNVIINYFVEYRIILINISIAFIFVYSLALLLKSFNLSFLISSAIINLLAFVNYNKIFYREEPLLAKDIKNFSEGLNMGGKYELNFGKANGLFFIVSIIITVFLITKIFKYKFDYKNRFWKLGIFLILTVLYGYKVVGNGSLYYSLGQKAEKNMWIEVESYFTKGFLYPLSYSVKNALPYKFAEYDKKKAIDDLSKYEYKNIPEDKKVNFVVIMLESYKDFYKYSNSKLKFNRDPYAFFHKLQRESYSGSLIVNSFGGGTFLTESNFLTGSKYASEFSKPSQGYVRYFKEQGYETVGFHPYTGSFYNRKNVYKNMGFDNFYEYDDTFSKINENILMDYEFYPFINEKLDEIKDNYFSFAVTYQNHGPYMDDQIYGNPIVEKQDNQDERDYNYFNNYLLGIEQSSESLRILVNHLKASNEPTVLVLFGDHSPSMGENKSVMGTFGIYSGLDTPAGIRNIYETPYLFWANDSAKMKLGKTFIGEGRDLEPAFLMNEIFNYIGYEATPYNQYMTELKNRVVVIKKDWFEVDGVFTDAPNAEIRQKIKDFYNVEYQTFYKMK